MTHTKVLTHISIDKNIKPDRIGFDQSAVVCPILHFIVFGKPVNTHKSHNFISKKKLLSVNSELHFFFIKGENHNHKWVFIRHTWKQQSRQQVTTMIKALTAWYKNVKNKEHKQ